MAELSGRQRAAAILAQLDDSRVAQIFASMSDAEVIALTTEIALLPTMTDALVRDVVGDLQRALSSYAEHQGGAEVAEKLLSSRLGAARAAELRAQLFEKGPPAPLGFLDTIDPELLARFFEREHPQLIVVILARLTRDHAAHLLGQLSAATRTEVARRLVRMRPLSSDATAQLTAVLEERLFALTASQGLGFEIDGMTTIVGILASTDHATTRSLLGGLERVEPVLYDDIRSRLVSFDDLLRLEDQMLAQFLRGADLSTIALALKGKPQEIIERCTTALSARRAEQLNEERALLAPQPRHRIEEAEGALVALAVELDEAGTITLERSDDPLQP